MSRPPRVVDEWREWEEARRIARSAPRRLKNKTEDDRKRAFHQLATHLKQALSGQPVEEQPEQPRLFDE